MEGCYFLTTYNLCILSRTREKFKSWENGFEKNLPKRTVFKHFNFLVKIRKNVWDNTVGDDEK